ncbi:MAG: tRNA uridine-5-carboxymethylaminomethyl(34) synthesis GTPase MnmE, partial [Firmicutes bacterium]|nr:tRNA uridine-5-carboxymethylaminomethyl(34) synthesis GTPase MnmE [Bacillota bacterium]
MSELIAALATAPAPSAIGVLRLSGPGAIGAAEAVFRAKNGKKLSDTESKKLVYGGLFARDGALLDSCLCTVSRAPHSYTGEDTAEFFCHGSPVALAQGLLACFAAGARQALPGEFTKRAFLNGRMDLTQAEAVADLIEAATPEAAQNAAGQLSGAIFRAAEGVYAALRDICAHFHAALEEDDTAPFSLLDYAPALEGAERDLSRLLEGSARGSVLKDGIRAAIIGRPNVGKSSLLNALLGYDRALVTELPGTTRDTVSELLRLGGVLLRLTDTAGLRETSDPVERAGVERARAAAKGSALVLAVFDGSEPFGFGDRETICAAREAKYAVAVMNKADLPQRLDLAELQAEFSHICPVSALRGEGLEALAGVVAGLFPIPGNLSQGELLTNV